MNIILNIFLLSIPARLKKRIAYLLSKYSKIFFESYLFQNIDFSLDKEISCLLELPVNFKNVIDGGANVGNWTECLLKQVNTIENLLLVEPNPSLKKLLVEKFSENSKIKFCFNALGHRDAVGFISYEKGFESHGYITGTTRNNNINSEISIKALDSIINKLGWGEIDLVKLDLEGFDYFALLGLEESLDKGLIKVIQFEVTRAWEKSCCSPQNAFQFLSKKNFTIFQINNGKLEELKLNNLPNFTIFSNFIAVNRSVVDN